MPNIDDANVRYLLDRLAISDVQLRYATGADTRDWALYRSCFTDEIETDFTSVFGGQPRRGKADKFVEAARRFLTGLKATQHMITNHVITIHGDEATCVAYVQARHHLPNETGDADQTMYGYYTNRVVRTADGWRISACRLTVTWNSGNWGIFELARKRFEQVERGIKE
ncbi:MAG: nuclear transport factor 2 family protein [Candidatus Binataceae bacterium]|jgi:3-phenylpropionate/cinnamic acid dioxygenase small subunit